MNDDPNSLNDLSRANLAAAKRLGLVSPQSLTRDQARFQEGLGSKLEEIEDIRSEPAKEAGGDGPQAESNIVVKTEEVPAPEINSAYYDGVEGDRLAEQDNREAAFWEEEQQKQKSEQQERQQQEADLAEAKQRDEELQDLTSDNSPGLPPGFSDRESDQNNFPPGFSDHGSDLQNLPPGFSDLESESSPSPPGFSDREADSGSPQGGISERNPSDGEANPPGYGGVMSDSEISQGGPTDRSNFCNEADTPEYGSATASESASSGGIKENSDVESEYVIGGGGLFSAQAVSEVVECASTVEETTFVEASSTYLETFAPSEIETSSDTFTVDAPGGASTSWSDQFVNTHGAYGELTSTETYVDLVGPSSAKHSEQPWTELIQNEQQAASSRSGTPLEAAPAPAIEPAPQPAPVPVVIPS